MLYATYIHHTCIMLNYKLFHKKWNIRFHHSLTSHVSLGRLYIRAWSNLVPTYLSLQLGFHFTKFGSTIGSPSIKPLDPREAPVPNGGNKLEAIKSLLRNQATSKLNFCPLGWPKDLAPFLCHVGWGKVWIGP
jgi:hypothetical protein